MTEQQFGICDVVSVDGEQGQWKIVGVRDPEPRFQIQSGADASTQKWVQTTKLKLISKHSKRSGGPGFYPSDSIMG